METFLLRFQCIHLSFIKLTLMTGFVLQGLESSLHIAVVGFCNRPRVGDNQRISAAVCSVFVELIHI